MTLDQARELQLECRRHNVPLPERRKEPSGGYMLIWSTNRTQATLYSYEAAKHYMRALYVEWKETRRSV